MPDRKTRVEHDNAHTIAQFRMHLANRDRDCGERAAALKAQQDELVAAHRTALDEMSAGTEMVRSTR
jgi:hypothetical protein